MTTKETAMTTKRKTGTSWRLSWRAGARTAWGARAAAHAAAAVDGMWARSSAGGSWNDAACAETTPGDWVFARRTDGTSFSWSVLPGGTMLRLR